MTNQEERLHFVFHFGGCGINVENGGITTTLDFAVLFDRLEDGPALISVFLFTGLTPSEE
jgi:hypothetical protein